MKSIKLPVTIKMVDDGTDFLVPLSIIFLAIVVSLTIVFLVLI